MVRLRVKVPAAVRVVLWLAIGNAVAAAMYLWLLNVPESRAWTVLLSGLLVLAIVFWIAMVHGAAAAAWLPDTTLRDHGRAGVRAAPMFLAGGLVFVALWWTTARAWEFFAGRSGEIEAWLIANVHTTRNTWVQVIVDVVLFVVRYVVGGAMWAAAIAAGVSRHRLTTTSTFRWLRAGLSRRLVGATAMLNVVLIFLPLRGLYWRPVNLPSTWVEPAFVGTKLALIYLCLNSAIALTLKMALIETQRNTATETSRRPATESRAPAPPGNTEAPARTQP